MILAEADLLARLDSARRVLLIEPPYERQYPPLGLMKIAAYVRARGGKVKYARGTRGEPCDLIGITSLFTYDKRFLVQAVEQCRTLNPGVPIVIGGILASLQASKLDDEFGDGVDIFAGYSQTLDRQRVDYRASWDSGKWQSFSFSFTSRGCPNTCNYCAVWRIEPTAWINPEWRENIAHEQPGALLGDNNLSATPDEHWFAIFEHLAAARKTVILDSGMEAQRVTPEMAKLIARVRWDGNLKGMRFAFDRMTDDGHFQTAIERLKVAGAPVNSASRAYVLFNFRDTPQEAYYRATECYRVGVWPYPQQFMPLTWTSRAKPFIGKHWTPRLATAFRTYWQPRLAIYTQMDIDSYFRMRGDLTVDDYAKWDVERGTYPTKWSPQQWRR